MIRFKKILSLVAVSILTASATFAERDLLLKEDTEDAHEMILEVDGNLEDWFERSYGYVLFPSVGKGGFWVGGAFGKGEVYEQGEFIGEARLSQGTVGFQFGGQVYTEIIFFKGEAQLRHFKESRFALSAQASAVAIVEGASRNAKYEHGVAVFTIAKGGIMLEASVGGQKFKFIPKG